MGDVRGRPADHAVTDEAMMAGVTAGIGTYEAVCGAMFLSALLVCPPCRRCPRCLAFCTLAETSATSTNACQARAIAGGGHSLDYWSGCMCATARCHLRDAAQ
jgi:hypothetical protein